MYCVVLRWDEADPVGMLRPGVIRICLDGNVTPVPRFGTGPWLDPLKGAGPVTKLVAGGTTAATAGLQHHCLLQPAVWLGPNSGWDLPGIGETSLEPTAPSAC